MRRSCAEQLGASSRSPLSSGTFFDVPRFPDLAGEVQELHRQQPAHGPQQHNMLSTVHGDFGDGPSAFVVHAAHPGARIT